MTTLLLAGRLEASENEAPAAGSGARFVGNDNDPAGELLYNGIRLPDVWPPHGGNPDSAEPMPVPYLKDRPAVVPIDVGRQLFVDDFLIERTNLKRTFHHAEKYEHNPVIWPTTQDEVKAVTNLDRVFEAYVSHGGAFYDPAEGLYKAWFETGRRGGLGLAVSRDALHWERPQLGLRRDNVILPPGKKNGQAGGNNCLWLDVDAGNPAERYKYMTELTKGDHVLHTSPDGLKWSPGISAGKASDLCGFFYNPFRQVWVHSIKRHRSRGRCRYYAEDRCFLTPRVFDRSVYWVNADRLDPPDPEIGDPPQLYSLCGVAYESLILATFWIHRGPANEVCAAGKFPKITEITVGFSRDGFHWHRPDRTAFIPPTRKEGDWDRGNVRNPPGVCFVVGDQLLFPYMGLSGVSPSGRRGMYNGASIGMAMLRRDGFASLDGDAGGGSVLTRPVTFRGQHLFVNVECPSGELRAEVLDESNRVIEPFTLANCQPIAIDKTLQAVHWSGASDLASLRGKPVRFKFQLTRGKLFAFWVSPDATGASYGYVAAGGPAYKGTIDNVGMKAI